MPNAPSFLKARHILGENLAVVSIACTGGYGLSAGTKMGKPVQDMYGKKEVVDRMVRHPVGDRSQCKGK